MVIKHFFYLVIVGLALNTAAVVPQETSTYYAPWTSHSYVDLPSGAVRVKAQSSKKEKFIKIALATGVGIAAGMPISTPFVLAGAIGMGVTGALLSFFDDIKNSWNARKKKTLAPLPTNTQPTPPETPLQQKASILPEAASALATSCDLLPTSATLPINVIPCEPPLDNAKKNAPFIENNISIEQGRLHAAHIQYQSFDSHTSLPEHCLQARLTALAEYDQHQHICQTEQYSLSPAASSLLIDHFGSDQLYMSLKGNPLQHALHKECIELVHTIAQEPQLKNVKMGQLLVDWVDLGREYNQINICSTSMNILDFCWSLCYCTQALLHGCAQGALETGAGMGHFIINPIGTTKNLVEGLALTAYHLNHLMRELGNVGCTQLLLYCNADVDPKRLLQADQFLENCRNVASALAHYVQENPYDAIREGAKLITQTYLTGKTIDLTQKLLSLALQKAPTIIRYAGALIDCDMRLNNTPCAGAARTLAVAEYALAHELCLSVAEGIEAIPAASVYCAMNLPKDILGAIRDIKNNNHIDYDAHSVAQYEKLKFSLRMEEFTSIIDVTEHGIQRLIERGFEPQEVKELLYSPTIIKTQADGLKAYIKETNNRFNIIVLKDREVVTALKGISEKYLRNLGKNYGWQ